MKPTLGTKHAASSEYATFYLKDALCGIALDAIQEINKPSHLTAVPQAPDDVMGIVNLRGKIVTVIDTGKRLGLSPIDAGETMRTIIVNDGDESVGLMVDRIANVIKIEPDGTEAPPANIGKVPGRCFDAVYKTEDRLVGLLALESVVQR